MIAFPNAKINLGLQVIRKRPDGFHDLQTVFYPVALQDALEIVTAKDTARCSITGLKVEGDPSSNSCMKAYELLKKDFPQLPPISMHLHKTIPTGAGLGGGSADGAFALVMLNEKYHLGLSETALEKYALEIGSDAPFFIRNQPAYAEGRGEILLPVRLQLQAYHFVLVNPKIHIATPWAFSQVQPAADRGGLVEIINSPVASWRDTLLNDFELPVFREYPEIGDIKKALYAAGALYASLSGSGATVFGIFERAVDLSFPAHYLTRHLPPTN